MPDTNIRNRFKPRGARENTENNQSERELCTLMLFSFTFRLSSCSFRLPFLCALRVFAVQTLSCSGEPNLRNSGVPGSYSVLIGMVP